MIRIVLFLAIAAISGSAMSVPVSETKAYNVGKTFLNTLKDLTAESEYSEVQRKLNKEENPEMRIALNKAFVESANGDNQLKMREVVKAFEEISKKNNLTPDEVLNAISNDPLYVQFNEQLAKSNLHNEG